MYFLLVLLTQTLGGDPDPPVASMIGYGDVFMPVEARKKVEEEEWQYGYH